MNVSVRVHARGCRGSYAAQRRMAYRRLMGRGVEADPEAAFQDFQVGVAQVCTCMCVRMYTCMRFSTDIYIWGRRIALYGKIYSAI